jgi:hypothetical protein
MPVSNLDPAPNLLTKGKNKMSTPLNSLTVSIAIDNSLRLFTVTLEDEVVVAPSLQQALTEALQKLVDQHDKLQHMDDSVLTSDGQSLRDQPLDFGTP